MELTNEQRACLGLELIEPAWERVEIPNNSVNPEHSTGKDILFFDGDVLRKVIWLHDSGSFLEDSWYLKTQDNRTMIAPITAKGKPRRLNGVNIQRCTPRGMYFSFNGGHEQKGGAANIGKVISFVLNMTAGAMVTAGFCLTSVSL